LTDLKEEMNMNIAIDGPAGAGKSTIAKMVAKSTDSIYVDTGAMYRAMALYMLKKGIDGKDRAAVESACDGADISIEYRDGAQRVILNGEDVTDELREERVGNMASVTSAYGKVRAKLVSLQQELARKKDVVMDGRDIGTVVLPNADVKIYLTASPHTRAIRRFRELEQKNVKDGQEPLSPTLAALDIDRIEKDIRDRDYRDSHREISPLKQADDAVLIDSSDMTIDEVVVRILDIVDEKNRKIRDKHITYSDVQN
jgi:cytidylate kinase